MQALHRCGAPGPSLSARRTAVPNGEFGSDPRLDLLFDPARQVVVRGDPAAVQHVVEFTEESTVAGWKEEGSGPLDHGFLTT